MCLQWKCKPKMVDKSPEGTVACLFKKWHKLQRNLFWCRYKCLKQQNKSKKKRWNKLKLTTWQQHCAADHFSVFRQKQFHSELNVHVSYVYIFFSKKFIGFMALMSSWDFCDKLLLKIIKFLVQCKCSKASNPYPWLFS